MKTIRIQKAGRNGLSPLVLSAWIRPQSGRLNFAARVVVAAIWLYQGAWLKILQPSAQHLSIVRSIPYAGMAATWVMPLIGLLETAIAFWVLTGIHSKAAAGVQTVLLIVMNAGGLLWYPTAIPDPAFLIVRNIIFVAFLWFTARGCHD